VTPVGDGDPLVVVARAAPIAGVVVDEKGRPVAGARILLRNPMARLLELGLVLDASIEVAFTAVTGADGRFRIDEAPGMEAQRLEVVHGALVPGPLVEVPGDAREDMRVVLWTGDESKLLRGRVTDVRGESVPGALVSRGGVVSTSGVDGVFVMPAVDPRLAVLGGAGDVLRAVAPGVGSGEVLLTPDARGAAAGTVDVVLDQPPLAISGRVVDEHGRPVTGVMLTPVGKTPLGLRRHDHDAGWWDCTAEEVLGTATAWAGADGSFTLPGLAAREYRIEVLQSPALRSVVSAPIAAGSTDVELVFAPPPVARIAGRVVDRRGVPVPGVRIAVSRELAGGDLSIGAADTSDDDGRFALEGVAREGIFLRIEGESIAPEIRHELDPLVSEIELVVGLRRHVQVDWGDWAAGACALGVVAADGRPLSFMNLRGLSVTPLARLDPHGGLSPTHVVSDLAAEVVVVVVDGVELFRVPLVLPAGEVELVRLPCSEHVLGQPCPDHAHHDHAR
jgi:protocatechuate 3,4-dioxygenase beta subunit